MIQLFDFDGGIHPPENKHQSNHRPIRKSPLPSEIVLPLHQHIGAPSKPVVSPGELVLKGQIIAEPEGFVSAPLHAPTSGVVKALELRQVPHASGLSELCIVITPDGKDTWVEHQSLRSELGLSDADVLPADKVIARIRECGIAGLGGAGFPTAVKLHTGDYNIDTLVLNGAECEPYITADDMLMRERAVEVIRGAVIFSDVLTVQRCLIGVEDNKPEAIEALKRAVDDNPDAKNVQVITIPTKYPSGGEKQLIQILTGKEVPSSGIPANLGIVCQNVATAAAVADAVDHGLPLISRITTVTGDAIGDKGNWEVLFGTPVDHLLNISGYRAQKRERVVMGGPMMGFALPNTALPIVKTTNCLLAPTEKELPTNNTAMACIRCGMCADVCPADLLPQQLYWFSKSQELDKAEQHNLFDCIECGACSYVCPSEIPLVQYYRHSKGAIREERAVAEKAEHARIRYEARIARQEREKAEKEAKRKARAEATAKAQEAKKAAAMKKAETSVEDSRASSTLAAAPAVASAVKPDPNSLERLKKKLDSAESRLEKARQRLSEAEAEGSEKVPAIREALEAQQAKALEAKAAYEAARNPQPESPAPAGAKPDPNSLERLKKKWDSAESRLEKAKQRLSEAEAEGSEKVDAIREAFEAQKAKAAETKLAYESALNPASVKPTISPEPEAEATSKPDPQSLERLKKKWDSAESRLEKAKQRLSEAEEAGSDKVEAIREALEAQQAKAIETKAAYEAALNPEPAPPEIGEANKAPEINNKPDPNSPERLKKKWDSAESRLEKAKQRLSEAEASGSDKVDAIRVAMLAQQAKATETKAAYEAACAPPSPPSLSSVTETEESQPETVNVDPELEKLKRKVLAQKDRVEKARERLNMAQEEGLSSVDALERALTKQMEKLADLEAQTSSVGEI